jgi:predicted metal-dependent peptidase
VNEKAAQKLSLARTKLILEHGFFGLLALRLQFVERVDIPTLAVDGKHIFYNPDFVLSLSDKITQSAVAHEVMHCVLAHIGRRGSRDPKKWNVAGDYALNQILVDSGFTLGDNWLIDNKFKGMSADEIYNLLPDGSGDKGGEEALDEILPGDTAESAVMETEWILATIQAANEVKKACKLPQTLERFVEQTTKPQVNWREQLRRFVNQLSRDDYSWMRPNRRYLSAGLYLPGMYSEKMGPLVNAIDTSGSISQRTLDVFGTEITAAWDAARPEKLYNIYCDAEVNHVDEFTAGDVLKFKMYGGGGTDFCPPFEYVEEKNITPACFIYLTDGYGDFPKTPPNYPVLWCMTTDVVAPFGETIRIED